LATFEELTSDRLEQKLSVAEKAFRSWRNSSFEERSAVLRRIADLLEAEKQSWGRLMTLEMGKPVKQAVGEVEKCAMTCRYFADHGASFLADEETPHPNGVTRYLPLGTLLAVMPWNFPFWQVMRCLAPAIMAGNTMLLKHASNVPQCALAIEDIVRRAGLPEGVFQTLLIGSSRVADVIRDRRVAAVTLTGSEEAGAQVAAVAGEALKKCVLELGGNDPLIVLPSADLGQAVATGVQARVVNNGQSCVCAKRFIIHEDIYDRFEQQFAAAMANLVVGNPLDEETEVGPLANTAGLSTLRRQVEESVAAGARVVCGGESGDRGGNYFPPMVLADIPPDAPVYREEVFGPVAMLFRVRDVDEAIALANDSPYGLGSSVWTNDTAEQKRCIDDIEAGLTFINSMVASDPRLPFGGVKLSGYGRELGKIGAREFTNVKTVFLA
jgi:succinate-semialdehyde dehydrogenase/glutarate-semialdehyde dehydrogenase